MDNGLLVVIIGGAIGLSGTVINIIANNMRSKRETRLQHLKDKRDRLDKLFNDSKKLILKGCIEENKTFPIDFYSTIENQFPEEVTQACYHLFEDKDSSKEAIQAHYIKICLLMEQALTQIDDDIEKLVK